MRRIINSAFVSLDGVTADPHSWAIFDPGSVGEAVQVMQRTTVRKAAVSEWREGRNVVRQAHLLDRHQEPGASTAAARRPHPRLAC